MSAARLCGVEGCEGVQRARGLCNRHYLRLLRHGDPSAGRAPADLLERVIAGLDVTGDCWLWTRQCNEHGYGLIPVATGDRYRPRRVHRVLYELTVEPIPSGLVLDHLCRNPPCANPDHLEVVSQRENMRRARQAYCKRGHLKTAENSYRRPNGRGSQCRECMRMRDRKSWVAA